MKAKLISIGDELVLGLTTDTNASWLSANLMAQGIITISHNVVPDDQSMISLAISEAVRDADVVILSGGLGPTPDDLTRDAFATVMGVGLEVHFPTLERIEHYFLARGIAMPESCRAQAMIPCGVQTLGNSCGTASGLKTILNNAMVFVLPGVPAEMKAMFLESVLPILNSKRRNSIRSNRFVASLMINTYGKGESVVAEQIGDLMDRTRNPVLGITVSEGVVSVSIRSDFDRQDKADEELEKTALIVRQRLGDIIFGEGRQTLEQSVAQLLLEAKRSVVTVESCTAGWVGKLLTDPSGASAWYLGGWIVYADRFKKDHLGVPAEMLEAYGAVSEQVSRSMAERALIRSGADYALALTGIAGPGGATPEKPLGSVWIALGERVGNTCRLQASRFLFPGTRDAFRNRASRTAINMLRLNLLRSRSHH